MGDTFNRGQGGQHGGNQGRHATLEVGVRRAWRSMWAHEWSVCSPSIVPHEIAAHCKSHGNTESLSLCHNPDLPIISNYRQEPDHCVSFFFLSQSFKNHLAPLILFAADILKVLCANVSWNFGCPSLFWGVCHLKTGSGLNGESVTSFPNNGDLLQELIPWWSKASLFSDDTLLLYLPSWMLLLDVMWMCQKWPFCQRVFTFAHLHGK